MTAVNCNVLGLAELLLSDVPAWPLCLNGLCYRSMNMCWYKPRCSVICGDSSAWNMFQSHPESCRAELHFRFLNVVSLSYIGISLWLHLMAIVNFYFLLLLCPVQFGVPCSVLLFHLCCCIKPRFKNLFWIRAKTGSWIKVLQHFGKAQGRPGLSLGIAL